MPQIPLSPPKPKMGDRQEVTVTHPSQQQRWRLCNVEKIVEYVGRRGQVIRRIRRKNRVED